jgi:hypothetical protein
MGNKELTKMRYFLCSESVIAYASPNIISMPFKSGYSYDSHSDYFIAVIDFDKIQKHYNDMPESEKGDFWVRELIPGTMDVSKITLGILRVNGVFKGIEIKTGLTTGKNLAMAIHNLCEKFDCNPIEFIDKLYNTKNQTHRKP